jgi:YidC/Oxa1 family membrane protein insertase
MKARQIVILIVLGIAFIIGWQYLVNWIWPTKPKPSRAIEVAVTKAENGAAAGFPLPQKETAAAMVMGGLSTGPAQIPKPNQETITLAMGGMTGPLPQVARLNRLGTVAQPVEHKDVPEVKAADPLETAPELIAMGHGEKPYYLQVLLNTRGGSVQQIILTEFPEVDREGLEVRENGKPKPLPLIPGVPRQRADSIRGQRKIRDLELKPGRVTDLPTLDAILLAGQCYVMYHYDKPSDDRPLNTLGAINWKVVEVANDPAADEQKVVFQAELGEPQNLVITKTFTLKRKEYHLGLKVDIQRKPGAKGPNQFRYQISGAHGLPIEGEWYTSTYRQAIVGFADEKGNTSRFLEEAREIRQTEGSDRQTRTDKLAIRFAAVTVQYFASAIAVDDQQEKRNFLEFVRATPMGPHPPPRPRVQGEPQKYWDFLDDATVRAITETLNPDQDISHKYLLYQGPIKVRLLRQLPRDQAVDDALVDRYIDKLTLDTMTDFHSPTWLGRFANAIFWSDLVIAFTNIIHSLLWLLYQIVPNLGVCIILLTVIVRGMLFPLSRRQTHNAQVMQQKMAKLQPELKKIQEKYGGDFQTLQREKMKLFREHGVNPFAAMGGCLLLLLQMPVMMGLWYALQESVSFRLQGFLWINNLAAPDMLIFWGESIWFISTPDNIGEFYYLGPYFNILPLLAVGLMLYQQKKMMPVSDDPQVQAQQRMMKIMMIFMAVFFYKVAAGVCIYFIASTLWGLLERRFMPKPVKPEEIDDTAPSNGQPSKEQPARPLGWWGRLKKRWKDKWQDILEQAQKQAEHRREQQQGGSSPTSSPSAPNRGGGGGGRKKKRKKR